MPSPLRSLVQLLALSIFAGLSPVFAWLSPVLLRADDLHSRRPFPPHWRAEAELRDIYFWDGNTGWAVGDCGTILKSSDGGLTWNECQAMRSIKSQQRMTPEMKVLVNLSRQAAGSEAEKGVEAVASPISATLNSVHFIDADRGWAIGGYAVPYVDRTRAVVLKTSDGGATWIPQANVMAPRIVQARFQSASSGWAFGDAGYLFRSGFLTTSDGGLNWTAQNDTVRRSWLGGAVTSGGFAGIDELGRLRVFRGGRVEPAVVQQRPPQPLQAICMCSDERGFAVGAAGTLLETRDGGSSWSVPAAIAASGPLRHYDFRTVVCVGNRVWFAGNPGTHIFCYDFAAETLTASRTGSLAALNRLSFNGVKLGWACGQFGTILRTVDEGETWQVQRGGSSDAALLFLSWDDTLPALEAMARNAADEGLRAVACRVLTRANNSVSLNRSAEATTAAGCLAELVIDGTQSDQQTTDWARIEQRLVQMIRLHRPRAIVSASSLLREPDGAVVDVNQFLQRVIREAAAPEYASEQAAATMTAPWQVSQVLLQQSGGGHWPLADNVFLTRINRLLGDQVALSRALFDSPLRRDQAVGFELIPCGDRVNLDDRGSLSEGFRRLGIQLPQRGGRGPARGSLREVQAAMAKDAQLQSLLSYQIRTTGDQLVWQQTISQWLQSADEETTGIWLGELAEQYLARGKLAMASLTLEQLSARVPHHGLAAVAQLWLAQFGASRDAATAVAVVEEPPAEKPQLADDSETLVDPAVAPTSYESQIMQIEQDGVQKLVWVPKAEAGSKTGGQREPTPREVPASGDFWAAASRKLSRVKQRDPDLGALPQLKWLEARVTAEVAGWETAQPLMQQLMLDSVTPEQLRRLAQSSLQAAANPTGGARSFQIKRTLTSPWLDGSLDDEAWQTARSAGPSLEKLVESGSADEVWLTCDEEYLYLAIRCRKLPGVAYRAQTRARTRDERLDDHDRVVVRLDLDRDGYWPLCLSVDSRGAVADGCGTTTDWNPSWYVAHAADAESWTIEAALPLSQLQVSGPIEEANWGLSLSRHAPWQSADLWHPGRDVPKPLAPLQTPLLSWDPIWLRFE
ncbi:MAG: YCF48-related protein [Planctomycetota bacterium]|nr:YCF48-related protein [Blastopirellula sp.]